MPFTSRSQVRKFGAMVGRGEMSEATMHRWAAHTPDMKHLPERAQKRKGKSMSAAERRRRRAAMKE